MQRKIKLSCLILTVSCLFVFSGCNEQTRENLNQDKEQLVKKAQVTYDRLAADSNQLVMKMKVSGKETWQKANTDLNKGLAVAKQKLNDLKQAGSDTLQKTSDAFDSAADDLEDLYNRTKAEFEKSKQEPNSP